MTRGSTSYPSITVCIPSYKRPDYLGNAIDSVLMAPFLPNALMVVCRQDDDPSFKVIKDKSTRFSFPITVPKVTQEGFLPPIQAAIDTASTDILVFMDDDAVATPQWLLNIARHYVEPTVGGVGGRIINVFDGVVQQYEPASVIGRVRFDGRCSGNFYREPTRKGVHDVDFLAGGNMSFRTALLRKTGIDMRMANDVAFHWELDLGLSVRELGYRILFDPDAPVFHHTAPRNLAGMRYANAIGIFCYNFNYAYTMAKHLTKTGLIVFLIMESLVGSTASPGFLSAIVGIASPTRRKWIRFVSSALRGRFTGLRAGLAARRLRARS